MRDTVGDQAAAPQAGVTVELHYCDQGFENDPPSSVPGRVALRGEGCRGLEGLPGARREGPGSAKEARRQGGGRANPRNLRHFDSTSTECRKRVGAKNCAIHFGGHNLGVKHFLTSEQCLAVGESLRHCLAPPSINWRRRGSPDEGDGSEDKGVPD